MKFARVLSNNVAKAGTNTSGQKVTAAILLGYSALVAGSLFAVKRNDAARAKENALHPKGFTQEDAYILAIGSKRI
jgi:hypothetical protein